MLGNYIHTIIHRVGSNMYKKVGRIVECRSDIKEFGASYANYLIIIEFHHKSTAEGHTEQNPESINGNCILEIKVIDT